VRHLDLLSGEPKLIEVDASNRLPRLERKSHAVEAVMGGDLRGRDHLVSLGADHDDLVTRLAGGEVRDVESGVLERQAPDDRDALPSYEDLATLEHAQPIRAAQGDHRDAQAGSSRNGRGAPGAGAFDLFHLDDPSLQ
jgi:hypothetical protein